MFNTDLTETQAAARLAQKPFTEYLEGVPVIYTPDEDGAWCITFKGDLLDYPPRKTGTIKIHEADSFIHTLKRHGSLGACNLYLDVDYAAQRIQATAIFNDHGDEGSPAGWRDHRAIFTPRYTEEWKRWLANHKKPMEQIAFAHYLEENIGDIAASANDSKLPSGGDILEFVTKLEDIRKVKYGSGINLQNGLVQLEFTEDNETATKGKLELFREFAIGIRPFIEGEAYQIRAWLRYRIDRNTGQITFWYELQRAERILEDACKTTIQKIKTATAVPVIYGTPE